MNLPANTKLSRVVARDIMMLRKNLLIQALANIQDRDYWCKKK